VTLYTIKLDEFCSMVEIANDACFTDHQKKQELLDGCDATKDLFGTCIPQMFSALDNITVLLPELDMLINDSSPTDSDYARVLSLCNNANAEMTSANNVCTTVYNNHPMLVQEMGPYEGFETIDCSFLE